jgi:hypothetical protein
MPLTPRHPESVLSLQTEAQLRNCILEMLVAGAGLYSILETLLRGLNTFAPGRCAA